MGDVAEHAVLLKHCTWACSQPGGPVDASRYAESMTRLNCIVPLSTWPLRMTTLLSSFDLLDNRDRLHFWLFVKGNFGAAMTDAQLVRDLRVLVAHKLRDRAAARSMFIDLPLHTQQPCGLQKNYFDVTAGDYYTLSGELSSFSTPASRQRRALNNAECRVYMSFA